MPAIDCIGSLSGELGKVLSFLDSPEARAIGLGYVALRFRAGRLLEAGCRRKDDDRDRPSVCAGRLSLAKRANIFDAQITQPCALPQKQPAQSVRIAERQESIGGARARQKCKAVFRKDARQNKKLLEPLLIRSKKRKL